jgi:hypothetical protein
MADWNAFGAKSEGRTMGVTLDAAQPADCTAALMLPRKQAGGTPRFHQENAENPGGRSEPRKTTDERGDSMTRKNPHIGSSLNEFLKEEGILEEIRAAALKETLAWQVQRAMKKEKINKVQMARRMKTSRAALDRLLDPANASVTLQTLCRAARAIGRDLRIELI